MHLEKLEIQIQKTREKLKRMEGQAKRIRERESLAAAQKFADAAKRAGVDLSTIDAETFVKKLAQGDGDGSLQ